MESFSANTLTILVLIGVVLSGVAFITVSILIICLLCIKYRRSVIVSPVNTRSRASSDSYDSRRSSISSASSISRPVSSVVIKSPVVTSSKRQVQHPGRLQKQQVDSVSVIDEYSSDNQQKYHSVYKLNENNETPIRNESRIYPQRHQKRQQQQQPLRPTTNVQFNERRTPYPPDVLARERVMMTYLGIPRDNEHKQ